MGLTVPERLRRRDGNPGKVKLTHSSSQVSEQATPGQPFLPTPSPPTRGASELRAVPLNAAWGGRSDLGEVGAAASPLRRSEQGKLQCT